MSMLETFLKAGFNKSQVANLRSITAAKLAALSALSATQIAQLAATAGTKTASKAFVFDSNGLFEGRNVTGAIAYNTALVTNVHLTGEQTALTYTFAANQLKAGGILNLTAIGFQTVNAADTCTVKIKLGSTVISSVPLTTLDAGAGAAGLVTASFNGLVQVAGASGKIATTGSFTAPAATVTYDLGTIRNIDTTTTNTLSLTTTWAAPAGSNSIEFPFLMISYA